jgi:Uri superfamily endonuclease
MNGLEQRLGRHFREDKKMHWHIDHLLAVAEPMGAIIFPDADRECSAAAFLDGRGRAVPGFGCSDCTCLSHLYRVPDERLGAVLEGLHTMADGNR